jgi:hypothetical protein
MKKKETFVVNLQRPHCRTPIKPVQPHKIEVKYVRKPKHSLKLKENYED